MHTISLGSIVGALLAPTLLHAQTETFGRLQFSMPKAVREQTADFVSVTDSSKNAVCRYVVLKQAPGATPEADYKAAYADMQRIIGVNVAFADPTSRKSLASGHMYAEGGSSGNRKGGGTFYTELYVYSGGGQRLTAFRYTTSIFRCAGKNSSFATSLTPLESVVAAAPVAGANTSGNAGTPSTPRTSGSAPSAPPANPGASPAPQAAPAPAPSPAPASGGGQGYGQIEGGTGGPIGTRGWAYTSTTFSDGWKSTAMEQWVEGVKGDVTVRLHHPREEDSRYYSSNEEFARTFWQLLIEPRYRNITNWVIGPSGMGGFESVATAWADAIDPATNRPVHIVLTKRRRTGYRWIEVVTPTRAAFEEAMGPYRGGDTDWDRITNLQGLNRFSVAASDLTGYWSSSWGTAYQTANIFTGDYAGVLTQGGTSALNVNGTNYSILITVAQGKTGSNMDVQRELWKGAITVPDPWHVQLTGTFRGETRLLDASFEVVRGGRILRLDGRSTFRLFKVR
jgi:hypothetical protein